MLGLQVLGSTASLLLAWLGYRFTPDNKGCRCLYGDPCWPPGEVFEKLELQLSSPLIYPRPLARPCYTSPNLSECVVVHENREDGNWRSDHPGSMQYIAFETYIRSDGEIEACYGDISLGIPCSQGSVPPIGVDARSVEDIQAAVKFAAERSLRLVTKNTGYR